VKEIAGQTETVRELAALLDRHRLTEIRWENSGVEITLKREPKEGEMHVTETSVMAAVEVAEPSGTPVEAPFTGIFYRAPRPNEPPFVEPGDPVEEGQALCLIEANKVFSELTAPVSGIISRLAVENGALVQPGEALLYILPEVL